jgi:hypothetical protein
MARLIGSREILRRFITLFAALVEVSIFLVALIANTMGHQDKGSTFLEKNCRGQLQQSRLRFLLAERLNVVSFTGYVRATNQG